MAVSILQPTSLFEMIAARVAFRPAERAAPARPASPARSTAPSAILDLSKSRAYDAALEILGAYKLTGNFYVNLEIVLGALGARNKVTFDVHPSTTLYHPDCRHVEFRAHASVPPDRFEEIVRSVKARLAFEAAH